MINKIITGKLKALTGIHIGSGSSIETTDAPVFRSVEGKIMIPGTAIAGSLRALATRIAPHLGFTKCVAIEEGNSGLLSGFCGCPVCSLFGSITSSDLNEGTASKIWVYDAVLEGDVETSIRDGVGIDREAKSSSRAARAKYDFEVIPRDSLFPFKLALQDNVTGDEEKILASVIEEWVEERCYIGGNYGRGLGNMKLIDVKANKIDLSSIEDLMIFLKEDEPKLIEEKDWLKNKVEEAKSIKKIAEHSYLYNSFAQIDFILRFTGGFAVNDGLKSVQLGFDCWPKIENNNYILPGSSLRGILRLQAEKIARSLITLRSENEEDFLKKCPACNPLADEDTSLTSCNTLAKSAKDDEKKEKYLCLACQFFGSSHKGSLMHVSDGFLVGSPSIKIMDFLAIDRFTGGCKETAKFDAVVLWRPSFSVRIFIENPREWQLGWLMLALKDLDDGFSSIGFGQNKWFGKAKIENGKIKLGVVSDCFIPKGLRINNFFDEGIFKTATFEFKELINDNNKPLDSWIMEFNKNLINFKREDGMIPKSDTYFKDVYRLYPKEVEI